jgi:5-methylcytosine-specific restriction enzyme A
MSRRNTGPTAKVRQQIHARSRMRCERCGRSVIFGGGEIHHRQPRGMGGSRRPETNDPANLVMLCDDCHRWVESNRREAYRTGWLVRRGQNPADVPWEVAA